MTLTKDQTDEMLTAAKPLMDWLMANCHPHCQAEVTSMGVELTEGVALMWRDDHHDADTAVGCTS